MDKSTKYILFKIYVEETPALRGRYAT